MFLVRSFLLIILGVVIQACGDPSSNPAPLSKMKSIDAAKKAYFQFDHGKAVTLYKEVWENSESLIDDRVAAGQALMRIAWHLHEDVEAARQLKTKLEELDYERSVTLSRFSEIQLQADDITGAMLTANQALTSAETLPEENNANLVYAQAILKQAKKRIFAGDRGLVDTGALENALQRAEEVLEAQQGLSAPSLVALEIALILGRYNKALNAWRSFFHIRSIGAATSVLKQPEQTLEALLSGNDESIDYRKLFLALKNSRQFEAAALVAILFIEESKDPEISELLAYRKFLHKFKEITEAHYHRLIAGSADDDAYEHAFEEESKLVWQLFDWGGEPPAFSEAQFMKEIGVRFGAEISFKRLSGYLGVHMGHRVADENFRIEQYDEVAQLRFISLDFMVSNGFTSWFWDGRAEVGGWAENPIIIQVRSAYSDGGINAWNNLNDEKTRLRIEQEIIERRASDTEVARQDPYAYLPGLAQRMRQTAYVHLLAELRKEGLTGGALQLAFISEVERISLESSIVAHEGRHAIEANSLWNIIRFPAQKEFLAKLSEVAFSSAPKLAIGGGILSSNIGDDSAHGKANRKIMKALVTWMENNSNHIEGLNLSEPLLPQLDLLTDDEMRNAFRSMDYLAG